jgi:cyclopropane fatty-acyl-phospholipid synthase-like methyltransferase
MADLFQFIDDNGADKQAMVVKCLEERAQMPKFAAMRENYFDKIGLPLTGRIHELGCGTGAVCRAIASRPGFVGTVVGSDLSASLIETARDITAKMPLACSAATSATASRGSRCRASDPVTIQRPEAEPECS